MQPTSERASVTPDDGILILLYLFVLQPVIAREEGIPEAEQVATRLVDRADAHSPKKPVKASALVGEDL